MQSKSKKYYTPTVLTIAGSDSYAGAGVQIDSKTIHALGGYAFSAITALTAQNSTGVKGVVITPKEIFRQQLESILDDIEVDAVKIGMLGDEDIVSIVAETIDKYQLKNIVLDTVLVSSSGKNLLKPTAIELVIQKLFPRVDLITPNFLEVETLVGTQKSIEEMAKALFKLNANAVLIKGGHSMEINATDYLVEIPFKVKSFSTPRIVTTHTHGTGCLLSSAIATHLARGENLAKSVELSKAFLYKSINESPYIKFNYYKKSKNIKEPIL